ncbi:MAG: hypothetical protein ACRD0Q_09030 [Acidimicrobiales bacterium]
MLDVELPYGMLGFGRAFRSIARWACSDVDLDGVASITAVVVSAGPGGLT